MAQEIKQGNLFGRIGSGIGKGLAEQVPKEIERHRLSSGLKNLEQQAGDLTPFQQFSRLSSIPGVTPQMIQSGSELLKQQGIRNAYARKNQTQGSNQSFANPLNEIKFANMPESRGRSFENLKEFGNEQIVDKNPLRKEVLPIAPWSPERRDQEISRKFEQFPNITLPEAVSLVSDDERRELAKPEAERKTDEQLRESQDRLEGDFTKQLETKLQKGGKDVYADITGEMISNLKRGMERDLRTNPNATEKDVADKWSDKALDLSKAKKQMETLKNRDFIDKISKGSQSLGKLKSYQKIFSQTGNQEEFYNLLKSDFDLSPQGSAWLAFPPSKKISEYISNSKRSTAIPEKFRAESRKKAVEVEDLITSNDSLLAIAKSFRMKDPYFDQGSFFQQLREDQDNLGLTNRQKRELGEGEGDVFPNWGDIWLLP